MNSWIKSDKWQLQVKAYQIIAPPEEYARIIGQALDSKSEVSQTMIIQVNDEQTRQSIIDLQKSLTPTFENLPATKIDAEPTFDGEGSN